MTDRTTYVTFAGVRGRGWTDTMVRDLLGTPDVQGRDPRRWSLAPVRLYLLARVQTVERTPEFAETSALAPGRSAAAGAHAERRRAAVLTAIRAEPIEVPRLPGPELERRAVRHRQLLGARSPGAPRAEARRGASAPPQAPASTPSSSVSSPASSSAAAAPPGFPAGALVRWQVSYLRQALSRYEALLDGLYGESGRGEAERLLRRRLYEAIAAAYPALADECRRRIAVER
ncbi:MULTISPECIES: hypothetical protein [unclassified Streptomyces]|uniref:hypothetical protein n=1 Tax=unclassified Streptomyces TaxID=2593676 RepID=UPI0006F65A8E|nr:MULTISPECIES: hypothetical protein [unclassified Streptomyces]KQX56983.1 hypothetical protein ASD33_28460 [Streptomyces sp. Root1304]KRA98564.1 hypothetical protein ASE09_25270 [Streptomyces sp. Root66D1]